jgi:class 3 adenylate cyclase
LDAYARAPDFYQLPQLQAIVSMVDKDWELFTENVSHISYGWSEKASRRFAAFMRECVNRDAAKAFLEADAKVDVSGALPDVKQPTLVLQHGGIPFPPIDTAQDIASRIPDARLVVLEGTWRDFKIETALTAIDEFLNEGEESEESALAAGDVHTILFTDVEGSTALTQRLGDAKARELLREHERTVREALKSHGGSELKTTGDGFMASFSSATRALECSIAMQRAFAAHNESAEEPILVRVGLNAGEPIAEDEDLFGTAVNLAARICGHAQAGQILASNVVQELAAGKGFVFTDQGEATLKGFEKPVRLFEVRWQG